MTRRLRVGVVGAGGSGQGWAALSHIPALQLLEGFELSAVCAGSIESAQAAAQIYGVGRAYGDYLELVADPDIDVVTIAVKAPSHHAVVMAALRAQKHIYCEWPLGVNTQQAEEMAELARNVGAVTVVGLQARADPALNYLRDLIHQGYVGEVLTVDVLMLTSGVLAQPKSRVWTRERASGTSSLTVRGIHALDALCYCLGELVELSANVATRIPRWRVLETGEQVEVEVPDNVLLNGVLHSGAVVSAHIGHLPFNTPGWQMTIYGREGTARISNPTAPQRDVSTVVGSQGGAALASLAVPASYHLLPADFPLGPPHNVAALYLRLENAIQLGAVVEPSFDHALKRHRLIDAIQKSSDERCTVAIATH